MEECDDYDSPCISMSQDSKDNLLKVIKERLSKTTWSPVSADFLLKFDSRLLAYVGKNPLNNKIIYDTVNFTLTSTLKERVIHDIIAELIKITSFR